MTEFIWVKNESVVEHCWDCVDVSTGERLAFITQQADYQDRGHFMGMVDIPGVGKDDSWPNYYMRWDRAMSEITAFLDWRLNKTPCEQLPTCVEELTVNPISTFRDIEETQVSRNLEMYGIAFKNVKTGQVLDPNDIVVYSTKPGLSPEALAARPWNDASDPPKEDGLYLVWIDGEMSGSIAFAYYLAGDWSPVGAWNEPCVTLWRDLDGLKPPTGWTHHEIVHGREATDDGN